jgi:hypothetical protein
MNQIQPDSPYALIRARLLASNPSDFAIDTAGRSVWGVIMELGWPEVTVMQIALADGNASVYFSTGGGIIGGEGHTAIAQAAVDMTSVADGVVGECVAVTESPMPATDEVAFTLLTDDGLLATRAPEDALDSRTHPLSILYFAGHRVIGELRKMAEERKDPR